MSKQEEKTPLIANSGSTRVATEPPPAAYESLADTWSVNGGGGSQNGGVVNGASTEIERVADDQPGLYHCHSAATTPAFDYGARRTLVLASCICLAFMIAEIVGGIWANSLAIITDAAHLLTDFASFLISLFSLYVASRPPSRKMSFGWHRAEVLGAVASVLMIWVLTGVLVYTAIQRIIQQKYEINAVIMLITAGLGVTVNIIMGVLLHFGGGGHGHSHGGGGGGGHGHSHLKAESGGGDAEQKKRRNINVRAAFIHVLGDLVQSIGVFIAALVIYFVPSAGIADPICTFIFSVLVLITTLTILKDAVQVLMEGMPKGINFGDVTESLEDINGVVMVHDLRIWALTLDKMALSVHLAVDSDNNTQEILRTATAVIRNRFNIHESTVQIEAYSQVMDDCSKCEPPGK